MMVHIVANEKGIVTLGSLRLMMGQTLEGIVESNGSVS